MSAEFRTFHGKVTESNSWNLSIIAMDFNNAVASMILNLTLSDFLRLNRLVGWLGFMAYQPLLGI